LEISPVRHRTTRAGFTLIETAIVVAIVGVATVALMELLAAGSKVNAQSYNLTNGLNLASNVRERMAGATVADAMARHGRTFNPPIDARGAAIAGLPGWSQVVEVQKVDQDYLRLEVPGSTETPAARVTVHVLHREERVCSLHWLIVETQ
jgi:prepilin-type N-terminal cleavage/methylation domain-containing protein